MTLVYVVCVSPTFDHVCYILLHKVQHVTSGHLSKVSQTSRGQRIPAGAATCCSLTLGLVFFFVASGG